LNSAVVRSPDYAPAHALLASSLAVATALGNRRAGQSEWLDSALIHSRRAIELAPHLADGFNALGTTYQAMGQHEDARTQYRRALEVDSSSAISMAELAYLEGEIFQRWDESVLWYERTIVADPTIASARSWAAYRYYQLMFLDEARKHAEEGLRTASDDASLHAYASRIELAAGDSMAARRHFEAQLQLSPATEHARLSAWFAFYSGDHVTALRHADRVDHAHAYPAELRMFGCLYRATAQADTGEILLRRAEVIYRQAGSAPSFAAANAYELALIYACLDDTTNRSNTWKNG
jgi:tetratricopeptide (TPR) repeat protein